MTSFKSEAAVRLCTTMDVRSLTRILQQGIYDQPSEDAAIIVPDQMIDLEIVKKSGFVNSYLQKVTGGLGGLYGSAPYAGVPVNNFQNKDTAGVEGAPRLEGVTPAAGAITEQWTLLFSSTTAFTASGSISGAQGNGTTGSDFTTTDSDITIASGSWRISDLKYGIGDRLYIPVYKAFASIVVVTSQLAAAEILESIFSEVFPNESDRGRKLREYAMEFLNKVLSGDIRLGTTGVPSRDMIEIPFDITFLGDDTTPGTGRTWTGRTEDGFNDPIV